MCSQKAEVQVWHFRFTQVRVPPPSATLILPLALFWISKQKECSGCATDAIVATSWFGHVKVDPRAIKPKQTTKIDSLPATMAIWQAVHSGPTTLLPLDPQVCRSMSLPALWSLAPGKNCKPFSRCSLMLLKNFSRAIQDALVHHGHHFGRIVHTFCNIQTLLTNGISLIGEQADTPEENLTAAWVVINVPLSTQHLICLHSECKEYSAFHQLLRMAPGLEDRLMNSSEEEVIHIANLVCQLGLLPNNIGAHNFCQVQKGVNGAHADDTKGMKSAIIDWITPKGQSLNPHIPCNVKSGHGFYHERTGALLCPAGLDWNHSEWVHVYIPSPSSWPHCIQNQGQACQWRDSGCRGPMAHVLVCWLFIWPLEWAVVQWPSCPGKVPTFFHFFADSFH